MSEPMASGAEELDERGVTSRRVEWNTARTGDWAESIRHRDRARARELYEEFGHVLEEEISEEGGHPVLSSPEVNARIRRRLRDLPGTRALDVGCGPTPVAAIALAERGFVALGVEIAHSIAVIAKRTAGDDIRVLVSDGESLPFPSATFDVVTCDDVIEHVFDQEALLAELARVMRPGGRLLMITPNASGMHVQLARLRDLRRGRRPVRERYHITQSHVRELRWRELRDLTAPHFDLVEAVPIKYAPGALRFANRIIDLPGGARVGPVHFFDLRRRGGDGRPRSHHYAGRIDAESQTSPGEVQRAFAAALDDLTLDPPVLDVGTGVGANAAQLRSRGLTSVGVDVSTSALASGSARGPRAAADAARMPFTDGSFGSAVCTEVLEHVDQPEAVLAEIARVLAPGGVAYVSVPNYANLAGLHKWWADRRSSHHDWNPWGAHAGGYEAFMTGRRLARMAAPFFSVERVRGLDFGQALTGRFRPIDRLAWSDVGQKLMRRLVPWLTRMGHRGPLRWHGMHTELVLRRRPTN